jgi:tetratricopeptide (TPR) repeat protein
VDYSSRICTRTITPGYRFILCYNRDPWHTFRYFYPYYHRKYVFVSLGGYWPFNYRFIRYYWYGYHLYYWCGYYPIAREVVGSSYNYYTYNYYYDDNPVSYQPTSTLESQYYDNIYPQLAEAPADVTLADIYFEEAVKAFEEGNYGLAIEKFAKAMELAPDDMILPFAYSQALFAAQRYTEAAEVLRSALAKITSDKEGVFYPRGLYPKDEVLFAQLDMLTEKAELYKFDTDLQLLLGYQLFGLGQLDKAVTPLQNASLDLVNTNAATILLGILEKIKTSDVQNEEDVTNYPEAVITAPETKGVETEANLMSEIKFDDTQASAIGPNVICWSLSASFAIMSLVSILCSCKSRLDCKTSC